MNIDVLIVLSAIGAFFFFFALHVIIFRRIAKRDAVPWFFFILFTVGTILLCVGMLVTRQLQVLMVALVLYFLMACVYFMGVFGLLATSVRIRLLAEIAQNGANGVTLKKIEEHYNSRLIVKERLARFISSGDITYGNGYYMGKKGITFFVLPALILSAMNSLYGTSTLNIKTKL